MTPLRQRMLDDMQMRNLSRGTQMVYVRAVMQLARHYQKSPEQLQREEKCLGKGSGQGASCGWN